MLRTFGKSLTSTGDSTECTIFSGGDVLDEFCSTDGPPRNHHSEAQGRLIEADCAKAHQWEPEDPQRP